MLEVLVAMSILVIIMLMLTTIFDQSASTWESGVRETSRALEGRTIVNLIASDLELAVMNDAIASLGDYQDIQSDGLTFFRYTALDADATPPQRAIKLVRYELQGEKLERLEWPVNAPYNTPTGGGAGGDLLENVAKFSVSTPDPPGDYTNRLPEWIDIQLELKETANIASDIRVWSVGPDGEPQTDDDIVE